MKLNINYQVFGSLTTTVGDGVLAYSQGLSSQVESLGNTFAHFLSAEKSMLWTQYGNVEGLRTFFHGQGSFTKFPEQGREYNMRVVYELSDAEFSKIKYRFLPVLPALDKLHPYRETVWGKSAETEVADGESPLQNADVQLLYRYLVHAIVHNKRLFIHLGNDENYYGDELRKSKKLKVLLSAIDLLPYQMRKFLSFIFSASSSNLPSTPQFRDFLVVLHNDSVNEWNVEAGNSILMDWQGEQLKTITQVEEHFDADERRLQEVSPLLDAFLGKTHARSIGDVCKHFSLIPRHVDRILTSEGALSQSDAVVMSATYRGGAAAYRNKEVGAFIIRETLRGTVFPAVQMKDVLSVYPGLKSELKATDWKSLDMIANVVKNGGVKNAQELLTLDSKHWDIQTLCSDIFHKFKGVMSGEDKQMLREKVLPLYFSRKDLRCVFENGLTTIEQRSLLDYLQKNNMKQFCELMDEFRHSEGMTVWQESVYRMNYIIHQVCEGMSLSKIPSEMFGKNMELLNLNLLQLLHAKGLYQKSFSTLFAHVRFYEQQNKKTREVEKFVHQITGEKMPNNVSKLISAVMAAPFDPDYFAAFQSNPELLETVCPKNVKFVDFGHLYYEVEKCENDLPKTLLNDLFEQYSVNYLRTWFGNQKVLDSQYLKSVMDLCKTDKRVDYARKYVLTNFSNLEKTELKELREKFLAAYKHKARDVKAYRNKLSQLHTATKPLLNALNEHNIPAGELSSLYWKNTLRFNRGKLALASALALALAGGIYFGANWISQTGQTHEEDATVGIDTLKNDSLKTDSVVNLSDSLKADSLKKLKASQDSLKRVKDNANANANASSTSKSAEESTAIKPSTPKPRAGK